MLMSLAIGSEPLFARTFSTIYIYLGSGLEALGPVAPRARQRGPAKLPRGTCTHTRATSIMHQLFFPVCPRTLRVTTQRAQGLSRLEQAPGFALKNTFVTG